MSIVMTNFENNIPVYNTDWSNKYANIISWAVVKILACLFKKSAGNIVKPSLQISHISIIVSTENNKGDSVLYNCVRRFILLDFDIVQTFNIWKMRIRRLIAIVWTVTVTNDCN